MSDRHTDAAAAAVPDAGDDTLHTQIRDILNTCTCQPPPIGEGPQIDCPRHGHEKYQADALLPLIREHTEHAVEQARADEGEAADHWTTHFEWGVRNHEGHVGLHANEHSARETYQRQRDHIFPPQGLIRRTVTTLYSEWEAVDDV